MSGHEIVSIGPRRATLKGRLGFVEFQYAAPADLLDPPLAEELRKYGVGPDQIHEFLERKTDGNRSAT